VRSQSARGFYEKYVHVVHPLLLVVITAILFSNTFHAYFLQVDDFGPAVHSSRAIRDVLTRNTYGGEAGGNYRPLESLPHMMDTHFYGHENPGGRRITNIIIHTLNVLLVYGLGVCLTGIPVVGLTAGLLFAASPVHSQALPPVPWISGRTDLVVTFFYLLSVVGFITFTKKGSRLILFFASASFMCALLSKEMAITLPVTLLLYLLAGGVDSKDEAAVATSSNQREYLARSLLWADLERS
jgi:hypothetical protein